MNGFQCYLKRTQAVIPMEVRASKQFNFNLGVKLIRGAYMLEERQLAEESGNESPIWETIEETHACYNRSLDQVARSLRVHGRLLVASHNQESCQLAMDLTEELGLKGHLNICFSQLQGFSDHLTHSIARQGFHAYKYQPFGPTEQVMPYLVRRGQESKQVLREQEFQNHYLKREIVARLFH